MIHVLNSTGGSDQINLIRYEGTPDAKRQRQMKVPTPLITIDWNSILPEPPSNTSDVTKMDLEQVQRLTKLLSFEEFDFVMMVDNDIEDLFRPYVKKMGLMYPQDLIDTALEHIEAISLKLKYKFKRARPFQISSHLGYVISVIETSTHKTPSYPSGHQGQGSIIAELLSSLYPEHKAAFYKFAGLVGKARIMQGVHYPSDNEAGMLLARVLWENMKDNLDDKWTDLIKE